MFEQIYEEIATIEELAKADLPMTVGGRRYKSEREVVALIARTYKAAFEAIPPEETSRIPAKLIAINPWKGFFRYNHLEGLTREDAATIAKIGLLSFVEVAKGRFNSGF